MLLDENKQPRKFYHGTRTENGEFWEFDYTKAVKKGGLGFKSFGLGNYFTSNKLDGTELYGSRVIEAYLSINKPFIINAGTDFKTAVSNELKINASNMTYPAIQSKMRELGYDGVVLLDKSKVAIAVTFDSEQIKSATDNIGTFDSGIKDIRYKARSVDTTAAKRYNNYGWVRENNVLSADEYTNFTSEFSNARTTKAYSEYKSDLDEYMIAVGKQYGAQEGVKNRIVFAKGTITNPQITRIVEIDADNETFLSDERSYIYAAEKQGIRTKADDVYKVYTPTDARNTSKGSKSDGGNASNNNQRGADRGTGSGETQRTEKEIPQNLEHYPIVETFTDIGGRSRKVRRLNGQYKIEGTSRKNYLYDTVNEAIEAENDALVRRYASQNNKLLSRVKAEVANDPKALYGKISMNKDGVSRRRTNFRNF